MESYIKYTEEDKERVEREELAREGKKKSFQFVK